MSSRYNFSQNNQGVHADQALKNILIPDQNTYFRLSLFLWNPTTDAGAGGLVFNVQWTAPFGGVQTESVTLNLASGPAKETIDQGIWVLAGTPVQFSALGGGAYGSATYSYLFALSDQSQSDSCGGPIIPIPVPIPGQLCPPPMCQRCGRWPCCCNSGGGGNQPIIIIPGQQQPYPPGPYPYPRRMPPAIDYYDDDPPYNGPWQDCCGQ